MVDFLYRDLDYRCDQQTHESCENRQEKQITKATIYFDFYPRLNVGFLYGALSHVPSSRLLD